MQEIWQDLSSKFSYSTSSSSELPPCCGTGCAVCVLDMVEDYPPAATIIEQENTLPTCCNTGCLICVQDYPELYRNGRPDQSQMIALLEAIEAVGEAAGETAETIAAQN